MPYLGRRHHTVNTLAVVPYAHNWSSTTWYTGTSSYNWSSACVPSTSYSRTTVVPVTSSYSRTTVVPVTSSYYWSAWSPTYWW